ncbi:hypothetical protein TrVE_jg2280 [Triparma verrucosa]|uniref:Protein kinase domain-containing protein n=1 Tax=Triparma verrucosa TaxID=1606542 RepID=A0A9W7KT86_9STRA|nr:hypothetical protein TrVE_jg2280 [Triparma verrucosa]
MSDLEGGGAGVGIGGGSGIGEFMHDAPSPYMTPYQNYYSEQKTSPNSLHSRKTPSAQNLPRPHAQQASLSPGKRPSSPNYHRPSSPLHHQQHQQHQTITFPSLKLSSLIGGGGFGQVWSATYHGTPVAVKILTAQVNLPTPALNEFQSEVMMLSHLRHPNICLFMGANFEAPNRCIVTECVSRGSLWDCLRTKLEPPWKECDNGWVGGWPGGSVAEGTWPFGLVKRVIEGGGRGMAYLHQADPPVLHRDLKSANLLLDDGYNVKICDFGLARLKAYTNSHTGNTGTTQWMAPEVLMNQRYGEKADVYSFGVIIWEVLTRECPFEGMSQIQVAVKVLNEKGRVEVPRWCKTGCPKLAALVDKCLEHSPNLRPSFAQILDAVRHL